MNKFYKPIKRLEFPYKDNDYSLFIASGTIGSQLCYSKITKIESDGTYQIKYEDECSYVQRRYNNKLVMERI